MSNALEGRQEADRLSTGINGLDTVLGGGLRRRGVYLVNGPPGAGKTILGNQFCFRQVADGGMALYVTMLSEGHDRMLEHLASMRFFDRSAIPAGISYISGHDALKEGSAEAILRLLNDEIRRRHKVDALVLDGLFAIKDGLSSEVEFQKLVHDLQGIAALHDVTILALTNLVRSASDQEYAMVDGWIELRDDLFEFRAIRSMVVHKQRGSGFLRGRHLFDITGDGISVYPRIEVALTRVPAPSAATNKVSSGVRDLDDMLAGGFPASSATMLIGPSGSGKTTMGLQFLAQATPEAPGLLFNFYETPARLATKARSIGIDLDAMVNGGALEIAWQPLAENLVDALGHRLLNAVRRRRIRYLFVDGINGIRASMVYENRLPLLLNALNNVLRGEDVTILYTHEIEKLSLPTDLTTDHLSAMVDNVVVLHLAMKDDVIRRRISVLKMRDSDFDPLTYEFHVSDGGIVFGPHPASISNRTHAMFYGRSQE